MNNPQSRLPPRPDIVPVEAEWLAGLREGNAAAFEGIFRTYYTRLAAVIYGYVDSTATSEELVQELFLRLWRQRATLEITDSLQAYLYRAARNSALNYLKHERIGLRWEKKEQEAGQATTRTTTDDAVVMDALATALDEAIATLPERCRLVFVMSRRQGLSYNEIAQALGITPKTVEGQIGKALRVLRQRLEAYLD